MSKAILNSPKDCMDHHKVDKFVKEKNVNCRNAPGSHIIMEYNGHSMSYCTHDTGIGLACKIWKWFKLVGLLLAPPTIFVIYKYVEYVSMHPTGGM